ncbi:MAG TPA: hypothetical protein VGH68_20835, partial [Paraburkholderia sp.]
MGAKGPLDVVNAQEWIRRTALTLKSRSTSTRRVDAAYAAWCTARFDQLKAASLRDALDDYVAEKGGSWARVTRNVESGGLMEFIYREVSAVAPARPSAAAARRQIQNFDIPHSRYGVLYLLGNIDIDMNYFTIAMEGVASVGGAVGAGFATNTHHLDSATQAARHVDIGGHSVSQQALVRGAGTVVKSVPKIGKTADSIFGVSAPLGRERRWAATGTVCPAMDNADSTVVKSKVTWTYPVSKAGFEVVKEDPALLLNPWVLPATLAASALITVTETL